jgi:hypothetical protein
LGRVTTCLHAVLLLLCCYSVIFPFATSMMNCGTVLLLLLLHCGGCLQLPIDVLQIGLTETSERVWKWSFDANKACGFGVKSAKDVASAVRGRYEASSCTLHLARRGCVHASLGAVLRYAALSLENAGAGRGVTCFPC